MCSYASKLSSGGWVSIVPQNRSPNRSSASDITRLRFSLLPQLAQGRDQGPIDRTEIGIGLAKLLCRGDRWGVVAGEIGCTRQMMMPSRHQRIEGAETHSQHQSINPLARSISERPRQTLSGKSPGRIWIEADGTVCCCASLAMLTHE